jgi:group I intron endonuclease
MESCNNGMMKCSGIYKLYWDNNDYYYYGQAVMIDKRIKEHIRTMTKGIHRNKKIQSIFNKYGEPQFVVCEVCEIVELNYKEQSYLDIHFGKDYCCNINPNAQSSKGKKCSDEVKKNLSVIGKNRNLVGDRNPFYGKKHTKEVKALLSKQKKGTKNSKLSESKKGWKPSDELKKIWSEQRKYSGSWKAKLVLDTQTGVFYSCAKEVSDLYNFNQGTFSAMLSGNRENKTRFVYA